MNLLEAARRAAQFPRARLWAGAGLIVAAVGALIVLGGLGAWDASAPALEPREAPAALTVTTVTASRQSIERAIVATGSVVAWQELSISSEIGGLRVVDVPVDEGEVVKRGQLLAEINSTVIAAQLRQQEAAVREAAANLTYAQSESRRAQDLLKQGNISPQIAEDRETKAQGAAARLALAQAHKDEMHARYVATKILAPSDGYVSKRAVLIGDVVVSGKEIFRMVRDSRHELDMQVPENDLALVQPGQRVRVTREGMPIITATVRAVAPTVDPKTRLGTVHVALPPDSPLKPGMFARADIMTSQAMALAVPDAAVVWRDAKASVFVLTKKNHVAARAIETGVRQNGWVEVLSGLEAGEPVINTGAGFLHEGDVVAVQSAADSRAAAK